MGEINKAAISYGLFYYNSMDNLWALDTHYVDPVCNIHIFLLNTKSFQHRSHYQGELSSLSRDLSSELSS